MASRERWMCVKCEFYQEYNEWEGVCSKLTEYNETVVYVPMSFKCVYFKEIKRVKKVGKSKTRRA